MGQIPKNWNEDDVFTYFRKFGEILEVQIMKERNGTSKGCAFVKFESMTKAEEAIATLKGTHIEGVWSANI